MTDAIDLVATVTQDPKTLVWEAAVKGYPVAGVAFEPEMAIKRLRISLCDWFTERLGRSSQYVEVSCEIQSMRVGVSVKIAPDRATTLAEFSGGEAAE